MRGLLSQNSAVGIVAVGMTFVLIAGGFDLSVAGIVGLAAVVFGLSETSGVPVGLAVVYSLAIGAIAGLINGVLVTAVRINAFIATLATGTIFAGLAFIVSGSGSVFLSDQAYLSLGVQRILGMPVSVWLLVGLMVILGFILAKSVYGRSLYFVGGNREAARLAGLRVDLLRGSTYVISGVCASIAAVIIASQSGAANGSLGGTIALDAITIVIIGGTSFLGGEGAMWKTAVGLLIIGTLQNAFNVRAIDPAVANVVTGIVLLFAVALDYWTRKSRA